MTTIPAGIAAEAALTRQNVTLSVIKQNAEQGQAVAQILDQSVQASEQGRHVDIFA